MAADQDHDLRDALAEFVTAHRVRDGVRPEIAASWQRSVAAELEPDRFDVPYKAVTGETEHLQFIARPILQQIAADFSSTSMSLVLTDRHGGDRRTARCRSDAAITSRRDQVCSGVPLHGGVRRHQRHRRSVAAARAGGRVRQ